MTSAAALHTKNPPSPAGFFPTLGPLSVSQKKLPLMVKATKFLRKQAAKAERVAQKVQDDEASREMLTLATAYRAQADVLKQKKKTKKEKGR